ncbi:hypothetical protein N510_000675 [Firmicutes bacterium ASF500]|nr:hypothetical protein N510_000675 [Firmicutes bacterium ASF500]
MSKVVSMTLNGVETKIEVKEEGSGGWVNNSNGNGGGKNDLTEQLQNLIKNAQYIIDQLKILTPDETEVNFGVKVNGEGRLLCFAEVGTEAQFSVKMIWKQPQKTANSEESDDSSS